MSRPTVLLAALIVLAGCGVPSEDTPRQISPPPQPYRGVTSVSPSQTTTGTVAQPLCFTRDGALVAVVRWVPAVRTIDTAVSDLLAGPTEAEHATGLGSAFTGLDVVVGVRLADETATVDLDGDLAGAGRNDQVLAFGQLVCTLAARADVARVAFERDGRPVSVPRADGSLSPGPLTIADYAGLIAPP